MLDKLVNFYRDYYSTNSEIPLHAPLFRGNEVKYLIDAVKSGMVSSIGPEVKKFESKISNYVGSEDAVATMNGTAALHSSLEMVGVKPGDIVITQPVTFVATCNAISYCKAIPCFVDVEIETLGMSPTSLSTWLEENAFINLDGLSMTKKDEKVIRACLPVHSFGHPPDMEGLISICKNWNLQLVEDSTEALGSTFDGKHSGTFGKFGTLSFNGNKIITTGAGGMVLCNKENADDLRHLTTTAKIDHPYEYVHDLIGYNYRMPNLNAALGIAQLEQITHYLTKKRELSNYLSSFFEQTDITFFTEPKRCKSNYWLNNIICFNKIQRDKFIIETNSKGIKTRPLWRLMNNLIMYENCPSGELKNAEFLTDRLVSLPSSVSLDICNEK